MRSLRSFENTIRICQIYYGYNWDLTFAPGDDSDPDPKHPINAMFELESRDDLEIVKRELDEILSSKVKDAALEDWFDNLACTTVGELTARDMLVILRDSIARGPQQSLDRG